MKIFGFTATMTILLLIAIACIMFCKNCSAKDATRILRKFFKDVASAICTASQPNQFYPTCVGFDGNRVLPQLVDDAFTTVRENFAVCYCDANNFHVDSNVMQYRFSIQRKPDSMDDETLLPLIQKQCEEVLAKTMRLYDCYLPPEPLTVVELFPNFLCVAFARNEEGIKEIDKYKCKIRRRKILEKQTAHTQMSENWHDTEHL
ncbi:hypothetical protein [Roseburia sp. 499]|uniref:hypothetical protein n=1 Tax=Roseburia sp. 499 TaxID=1261634 RepID=UPI000952C9C8|nr:hypothetical protein [Roseburia sp. 499]WVK69225.1 hypothetical protein BIV20_12720 [Roseburia sp. 499]